MVEEEKEVEEDGGWEVGNGRRRRMVRWWGRRGRVEGGEGGEE